MELMTSALRQLLKGKDTLVLPVVYDALTAKIALEVGFKAVQAGGPDMAAALGTSEDLTCLEDVARTVRYITVPMTIPVIVDIGAGFGEAPYVARAVREIEAAAAAGAIIDDRVYPVRGKTNGKAHAVDADHMVEKIKAAVAARRDDDFVIVARTVATGEGAKEAARRLNLYLKAGADLVGLDYVADADLAALVKEVKGPVAINVDEFATGGKPPSVADVEKLGAKVVSFSGSARLVAAGTMMGLMETIKATGSAGDQSFFTIARKSVEDTIGLDEMYRIEMETVETKTTPKG